MCKWKHINCYSLCHKRRRVACTVFIGLCYSIYSWLPLTIPHTFCFIKIVSLMKRPVSNWSFMFSCSHNSLELVCITVWFCDRTDCRYRKYLLPDLPQPALLKESGHRTFIERANRSFWKGEVGNVSEQALSYCSWWCTVIISGSALEFATS